MVISGGRLLEALLACGFVIDTWEAHFIVLADPQTGRPVLFDLSMDFVTIDAIENHLDLMGISSEAILKHLSEQP